jgi:hypothetical protein
MGTIVDLVENACDGMPGGLLAGYITNLILREPVGAARGAPVAALGALIRERGRN